MTQVPDLATAEAIVAHATKGKVVAIQRQARWRPTWFVDVECDGELRSFVLRGDRVDSEAFPLRHEYTFHRLLEERDIPVPTLFDYIETPGFVDAILMERVAGKPDFDDVSETDRDVIVDEYIQQLARLHQMDVGPFYDAGIMGPAPGEDAGMVGHRHMESNYRARKNHPDPFAEFCLGWHHRHMPKANGRLAACVWDSGQFHHENGHLVAILDLEFGHIGDPLGDITVWRMRDTLIPFGDMGKIYSRYESLTGVPLDIEMIKRHHFACTIGNQLQFGAAVAHPLPETDLMNIMQWDSETNLMATDFLGEYLGIELPNVEVPDPKPERHDVAFAQLVRALRTIDAGDPQAQHELRLAFRTARHLQRRSEIGGELDKADLDDLHELLGHRPESWLEGEIELEQFCLADAEVGRYDEKLTILFHKRNLRTHMSLGPPGSSMTRHYECQRFDGRPAKVVQL